MTTTLEEPSSDSNGLPSVISHWYGDGRLNSKAPYRTFTSNYHLRRDLSMRDPQKVPALNAGAHRHRRALVRTRARPVLVKFVVLEAVGVDDQGAPAGAP